MPVQIHCHVCQKPYLIKQSHVSRSKCCSKACRNIWITKTPSQLTCQGCGTKFKPLPGRVEQKYCSRDCIEWGKIAPVCLPGCTCKRHDFDPWVKRGRVSVEEKFQALWDQMDKPKDPKTCWEWPGTRNNKNYGALRDPGNPRAILAHRMSYEKHIEPLSNGEWVLHHCDNPPCVRPQHLHKGDLSLNQEEAYQRGLRKAPHGEKSVRAKLTNSQAEQVRRLYKQGWTQQRIADFFGLHPRSIGRILSGDSYKS